MKKIGKIIHKSRSEITGFCNNHKKIYIYGAGMIGVSMAQYLKEEGINFESYLVSSQKDLIKNEGINIVSLDSIKIDKDTGIIISCSQKYRDEIIKTLMSKGAGSDNIFIQHIYGTEPYPAYEEITMQKSVNGYYSDCYELNSIGEETGTDKGSACHDYLNKYEFFLSKFKRQKIKILELGIFEGASLKMWERYFPDAEITGIDVNPECKKYGTERCGVIINDLGNEDFLEEIAGLRPDIIIDDASHFWSHQIKAFLHLFPALRRGGIYILEDLGTSFKRYSECIYQDAAFSAYDLCLAVSEIVTGGEYLREDRTNPVLWELKNEIESISENVETVMFLRESCIFVKK